MSATALCAAANQPSPPGQTLHFAYGANLSRAVLAKRGVVPIRREPAVASEAIALAFQHRGGFATLQRSSGAKGRAAAGIRDIDAGTAGRAYCIAQPHGVLYLLDDADLKRLEGRETGYSLQTIAATTYSSGAAREVQATAFFSRPALLLPAAVPPTQRYKSLLVEGARQNDLDHLYIEQLAAIDVALPGGLPPEYFDTPSKGIAAAGIGIFVIVTAILVLLHTV